MAIAPINGFSAKSNYNSAVNFGSKNYDDDYDYERSETRNSSKLNKMVSVPVGVLLALSPSLLNAHQPVMNVSDSNVDRIEYVENLADIDEVSDADAVFEAEQQRKKFLGSAFLGNSDIRYYEKFKPVNSETERTMVFASTWIGRDSNGVDGVYLVPKDHNSERSTDAPPKVTHLIFHDLGEGKEFCGLLVYEVIRDKVGNSKGMLEREIVVPEKIANKVIDLMVGDTEFKNNTGIKLIKTKSAATVRPHIK